MKEKKLVIDKGNKRLNEIKSIKNKQESLDFPKKSHLTLLEHAKDQKIPFKLNKINPQSEILRPS